MAAVTTEQSPYLEFAEATDYSKQSRSSLYRAIKAGRLKPYKVGGRVLFTRQMLDDFIQSQGD